MSVGLLDAPPGRHAAPPDVGRHALSTSYGLILGERPDTPSVGALKFIDKAAHDPPSRFSYGEYFDRWDDPGRLTGREAYAYGTIGARRINTFYAAANELAAEQGRQIWNSRAVTAASAILEVADSPDETEALALQVPFDEWRMDSEVLPIFEGWIRQMVDAYDHPDGEQLHLLRDDSQDKNADQFGALGTKVWLGTGKTPLIVYAEPAIRDENGQHRVDDNSQRRLMYEVWIAKRRTPEEALRLLNRHDVIARERISRLLDEADTPATPDEKTYILWYADRAAVQNDNDAKAWLEWYRSPVLTKWQRFRRAAAAAINAMADSDFVKWIERHT